MRTVLELLTLSADYLEGKDVPSARLNAETLLADVLACKRLELYLRYDQPLKESEVDRYREYIARRGKYEPTPYILGSMEFYGVELEIDRSALIPRQETEILVEAILDSRKGGGEFRAAEIGVGSGAVSLAAAANLPEARIVGYEKSEAALALAKRNAERLELADRVEFRHADVFDDDFFAGERFDLVFSNPPYVSENEYKTLQPEILKFEPPEAVTDFADGFAFYRRIAEVAKDALVEGGALFFEVGDGKADEAARLMTEAGYRDVERIKDYIDVERVVKGARI
ncbi:MAG: peptide chain release factor N(5)-glutamine methyltransferase [Ignavibacteriales bacterium]|nr:peptide chain release factor N(5)-glutamine methyltransferase [Ignavibacteriales bacterium]